MPIPKKLATKGVKDMVRVSDARMSGTAFGTIVLHVTPDSASGGPLRLVRNGDRIRISVEQRRIDLVVDDAELKRRSAESKPAAQAPARGYARLYAQEILGADQGCDFRILEAALIGSASRLFLVLPVWIEHTTSPLPRGCSTTELRQRKRARTNDTARTRRKLP